MRDTCATFAVKFDQWQQGAGRLILAKGEDGLYASDTVVISIPRQVGKTYLIGWIVFALCIKHLGLTVVWTAHRYKTASETFKSMAAMARGRRLVPHVDNVTRGAGDQAIEFVNGSRIIFGARERGFGRGFSEVDVIIFDEAQILTQNAVDDMVPATNASPNPLVFYIGTPPKPTDSSEVFTDLRQRAIRGESDDVLYIEISADQDADPLDREQWSRANPSYPSRTPERSMLRMWRNLTRDSFLREALGIWDDAGRNLPIPLSAWSSRGDTAGDPAPHVGQIVLAVDADPARLHASIAAAGARADGPPMVELIDSRGGVEWAVERLVDLCRRHPVRAVVIDSGSAAMSLHNALVEAHVQVVTTTSADYGAACGLLHDAVVETGEITHLDDPLLVAALRAAATRKMRDAWLWDKSNPAADITPLVAVTLAYWGHVTGLVRGAGQGRVFDFA